MYKSTWRAHGNGRNTRQHRSSRGNLKTYVSGTMRTMKLER
jgi:hypothetical protein